MGRRGAALAGNPHTHRVAHNEDELTLKEIGDKYNLSRERIRQLQEQAIGKIRRQMREF
jgi:DNA-directed RNA polymerase sigma subunit (sigma70/sigma32)